MMWQPGITLKQMEREIIESALRHFQGNKSQTAIALGVSVRTIDNKLAQYKKANAENKKIEAKLTEQREQWRIKSGIKKQDGVEIESR